MTSPTNNSGFPEEHESTSAVSSPEESTNPLPELYHGPKQSRRGFLTLAAGAGAAVVGGAAVWSTRSRPTDDAIAEAEPAAETADGEPIVDMTPQRPLPASADTAHRTLVVVELQGGNDGLATLVPREAGTLYDRREGIHVPDEELLDFTDDFGWNPNLAGLSGHGIAAVLGLGTTNNPDGSHFEMERRWWAGKSNGRDVPFTGFFGRLCDQLAIDQPVTGVSLGSNASPALRSDHAVTVGLSSPRSGWFLHSDEDFFRNMQRAMAMMANGTDMSEGMDQANATERVVMARAGLRDTLAFGDTLAEMDEERMEERYPQSELGELFGAAAELIRQESGVRVIHLTHGGFDTHSDQRGTHDYLLAQLGESMGAFLADIDEAGYADSTLVCTTSEFGRRLTENDGGSDHGQAGMAMLSGPVNPGVHGEAPSLTNLDDGNLIATVDFEQYYATIAEQWFGIPSSEVLDSGAAPIEGLIAT